MACHSQTNGWHVKCGNNYIFMKKCKTVGYLLRHLLHQSLLAQRLQLEGPVLPAQAREAEPGQRVAVLQRQAGLRVGVVEVIRVPVGKVHLPAMKKRVKDCHKS